VNRLRTLLEQRLGSAQVVIVGKRFAPPLKEAFASLGASCSELVTADEAGLPADPDVLVWDATSLATDAAQGDVLARAVARPRKKDHPRCVVVLVEHTPSSAYQPGAGAKAARDAALVVQSRYWSEEHAAESAVHVLRVGRAALPGVAAGETIEDAVASAIVGLASGLMAATTGHVLDLDEGRSFIDNVVYLYGAQVEAATLRNDATRKQ
jgi:hypothetical protein